MAKRARGTSRPGKRRPTQRTTARPAGSTAPAPAIGEAATVEATVASTAVATTPSRTRTREASGTFSTSAIQEYAYVRSDLRRIAKVAAGLFGTMFVLFILIDVVGVIKL